MNALTPPEPDREQRDAAGLLEVLIRAGLILALVLLCLQVFAPFLHLMVWAVILAVSLYPLHQALARRVGGREGLAATAIVMLGIVLIVARAPELGGASVAPADPRPAEPFAGGPAAAARGGAVAAGRHEDLRRLGAGPRQSAGVGAQPAAEDRRPRQGGAGDGGQHRRSDSAIHRCPRHRRHHHGLRQGRRSQR